MIRAEFRAEGRGVRSVRVTGHAGYNPGNDPVCAGMSAAVWILHNQLARGGELLDWEDDGAAVVIRGTERRMWSQCAWCGFVSFAMELAGQYPEHVQLDWTKKVAAGTDSDRYGNDML